MQSEHLEKAIRELASREHEFCEATFDYPVKKHTFKVKFAVAVLKGEGSVAAKEAAAMEICSNEYLAYLQAEARAEVAKTLLWDVKSVLDARRSLLSFEKSEMEMAGNDGST